MANTPNGDIWISRRRSGRAAPRGRSPAIPFNRRCDSSDFATDDRRYVYLYTFGYRVEPLGSPTLAAGKTSYVAFGYRAESPGSPTPSLWPPSRSWFSNRAKSSGSPTVADGSAGQKAIPASEPDEKRRHSCFNDPGREVPSGCGSPQASIPAPTAVFRAILSPRRAAACPLRVRSARRCPSCRAPSRTRGSANAA